MPWESSISLLKFYPTDNCTSKQRHTWRAFTATLFEIANCQKLFKIEKINVYSCGKMARIQELLKNYRGLSMYAVII